MSSFVKSLNFIKKLRCAIKLIYKLTQFVFAVLSFVICEYYDIKYPHSLIVTFSSG